MPIAVPQYGSQVTNAQGGVAGLAVFNPNTGAPLAGAGAYNPNNGMAIPQVSAQISTANTTSSTPTSTPVISAKNAQADYNNKWAAYQASIQAMNQQAAAQSQKAMADQANQFNNDKVKSDQNFQQQQIDIQKSQADAQKTAADAKLSAANGLSQTNQPTPSATSNIPAGWNQQTYANFKAANPTLEPTPEDTQRMQNAGGQTSAQTQPFAETNNYTQGLLKAQDERTTALNTFLQTANTMIVGLQQSEAALVTATTQQFQSIMAAQQVSNTSQVGQAVQAAARSGQEYSPTQAGSTIANVIGQGNMRLSEINSNMAKTIAELHNNFAKEQYSLMNSNFDKLDKNFSERMNTFKNVHDAVAADAKSQQDKIDNEKKNVMEWQKIKDNEQKMKFDETNTVADNKRQDALAVSTIAKNKIESQKIQAEITKLRSETNAGGAGVTPVAANSYGNVSHSQQKAFLDNVAKTNPGLALQIKAAAGYTLDPKVFPISKGARENFDAMVRMYDPSYDSTTYAARQAYQKTIQSGTYSLAINSANKTINHLSSLFDSLKNLDNARMPGYNTINNWMESHIPNTNLSAKQKNLAIVNTESQGVAQELEKFFKGTGVSDVAGIRDWKNQVSSGLTPGEQEGLKQGALTLFTGQLDTLYAQYKQNMGKNPPIGAILQPETLSKLSSMGIDISPYVQGTPTGTVYQISQTGSPQQKALVKQMITDGKDDDDIAQILGE